MNVALHELWPAPLIAAAPECLVDFNVMACGANAMVSFGVHPNCGLMCGSQ